MNLSNEKPNDFLAIGEALVDFISTEISNSLSDVSSFHRFVGGQVVNTAMNMARLGNRSAVIACLGEDGFGEFVIGELNRLDIATEQIQRTLQSATTLSIITRHTETPDFIIHRGADAMLQRADGINALVRSSKIVHTSAFALSREPARSTIISALQEAKRNQCLVTLDPNYHPKIWPDTTDFPGILKKVCQSVQITKPSLDDCIRIFGSGLSPDQYADRFLEWGLEVVIITMGNAGTILRTATGERMQLHTNPIPVSDVTGAGDAFWSGFLSGWLEDASVQDSVRMGQVLAEIKIGTLGPMEIFPDRRELHRRAKMFHE
jgi:fructokinase